MISVFSMLVVCVLAPLGLEWDKKYQHLPNIEGYSYYYGDVGWGTIVYVGKQDLSGLETEIQLELAAKKLVRARLILGPAGLSVFNCITKYRKIITLLNKKYGNYLIIVI